MDILVTRSDQKFSCKIKDGIVQNCKAEDAAYNIYASDITKEEEIDILIRRLQRLKQEIADGYTKSIICPTERPSQTE